MPPPKGPIWEYFIAGDKQNESHVHAHCRGCIEKCFPDGEVVELDDMGKPTLSSESWVKQGPHLPFTPEQGKIVHEQFLHATVSANLLFRWVEDPEVMKLFLLFRSMAGDIMPSRQQVSGTLLDKADEGTYLVDLILATAHKKDGVSMCDAFEGMIDKAEEEYGVIIIAMCCDNDGGSQHGRKDVVLRRPWLFGPPCCAHQFQLILGDYFIENKEAALTTEEATGLIGWVLNHGRVRSVFNKTQEELGAGKVLAFLVANMTRWNTHYIAFDRLLTLKDAMRQAVILRKEDIISGQVGVEKNRQKLEKLKQEALKYCDLIDDGGFWRRLVAVVEDVEPICLGVNMNQTDALRPDQALITFAGIFLYFQKHPTWAVAIGMAKRLEKRWSALDQLMFILALVLNLFERLSRFGDKAKVTQFTLHTVLLETYRRVRSWPPKNERSAEEEALYQEEKAAKEKSVSNSFFSYLAGKGAFVDWEENKAAFEHVNGDDPLAMWTAFRDELSTAELVDFAITLLSISVNQAGGGNMIYL
ncbi:hypothetical protein DXG01_003745 [Tephrocybe rancida]|nr:hypothetical protein DXG01_003745 [Tephrocybe rancida]